MPDTKTFRLIVSPARPGPENMALDEALLDSVAAGDSPPLLRLYRWLPPSLSIGYSQPIEDVNKTALAERGWDLVRRPTGGRAILHADELTYAIVLPLIHPLAAGGVLTSYQHLSAGLISALEQLGLTVVAEADERMDRQARQNPVCFEVPSAYELTVQGKKLIGSAQVRRQKAMLQHGTLPLKGDLGRICDALQFESAEERSRARQRLLKRAGTMQSLLGKEVSWSAASQAVQTGFEQAFAIQFETSQPSEAELRQTQRLLESRYRSPAWTERI